MNYEAIPAFVVPVGVTQLDKTFCDPLKSLVPWNADIKEKDETFVFNRLDDVPELKFKFLEIFSNYINQILSTPNQEWSITSSWIIENTNGVAMVRHNHRNSYYSSVFYFSEVSEEHEPLKIESPINPPGFWVPEGKPNSFTGSDFTAPMTEGTIIFFPSYLYHYHNSYKATTIPRKALTCNYVPIGKYGEHDSVLDTKKLHG